MRKFILTYYPGIILLAMAMVIGMLTYQDYGMAWDEPAQHLIGEVNYNYAFKGDTTLLHFYDKEYGAGFELPLMMIEKGMGITDSRDIYLMRHLVTHSFFLLAMFCGYVLIYRLLKNHFLASLGFVMLVFMPRIYAHSFFNTKDIPFLSMLVVSLLVGQQAFERKRPWLYLLLGMVWGYTTGIRIMALLPMAFVLFFMGVDVVTAIYKRERALKAIGNLAIFAVGWSVVLYVCCPYFWHEPLQHFAGCIGKLAGKGFCGNDLLNGVYIPSDKLPWYYLPEWMGITIPVLWLVAGLVGIVMVVIGFIKKPVVLLNNSTERNFFTYLLCFLAPLLVVITRHSVVYDEWRHLYFIYPPLVLLAVYGVGKIMDGKLKFLVIGLCSVQVVMISYFMVVNHPLQNLYFNELVSHKEDHLRKNFEFDYWGTGVKQALDLLIKKDQSEVIKVSNMDFGSCVENNIMMMPVQDRKRILLTTEENSDYMITTFRGHPLGFGDKKMVIDIKVPGGTAVRVYRAR